MTNKTNLERLVRDINQLDSEINDVKERVSEIESWLTEFVSAMTSIDEEIVFSPDTAMIRDKKKDN